ncbi:MAG: hypothetical protein U9Q74_16415, partial [Gemmatimonadota bacterium]|nr:hypothetical protein [Gemmatimonadota bacterium]
ASVIHPDGRVVDVTYASGYGSVALGADGLLYLGRTDAWFFGALPYSDTTESSWSGAYTNFLNSVSTTPRRLGSGTNGISPRAVASGVGLTLIAREPDLSKSAVAHITKDYATGWMVGDCKLATLCDGTTGTITGGTVPDRSGAGNTLTVNGTLSRTADANTDLVWHGPFTTANYYSRAHDGDFDFDGDFDISLWASNVGTLDSFVSYQDAGESTFGDGAYIILQTAPDGAVRARLGGASGSVTLTGPIVTGTVSALRLRRTGSLIELLVNGRVVASTSSPVGSLANASATFRVGVITYNGALVDVCDGKIALLRLSATASTSAQAAKAYRDERARLQGYGLLGGTSNNVTSLAEGPTTGTLTAGTGDGASVFRGLRRIAYHDGASTGGLMTSDSVVAVGSAGGYTAIGTAAEAIVLRDAVDVIDEAAGLAAQDAPPDDEAVADTHLLLSLRY